jgi:hypothetical protein
MQQRQPKEQSTSTGIAIPNIPIKVHICLFVLLHSQHSEVVPSRTRRSSTSHRRGRVTVPTSSGTAATHATAACLLRPAASTRGGDENECERRRSATGDIHARQQFRTQRSHFSTSLEGALLITVGWTSDFAKLPSDSQMSTVSRYLIRDSPNGKRAHILPACHCLLTP